MKSVSGGQDDVIRLNFLRSLINNIGEPQNSEVGAILTAVEIIYGDILKDMQLSLK